MDLRQIEVFLSVARHLHFGKAAEELYLSQPAVSQAVHRLERELGGALFDRTTRRVSLTELGALFLPEAERAHAAVTAAYERGRRFASRDAARLVAGYSTDGGADLVALIPALQRQVPDLALELRAMRTPAQLRALAAGELDVALCWDPAADARFRAAPLGTTRLAALVRDDHPFAGREDVDLVELAAEPLVVWSRAVNPALYDGFAAAMDATGAPWALVGAASGAVEVAARVLSGFGVGVLFESVARAEPVAGVSAVVVRDGPVVQRALVWRADDRSELVDAFVAAAVAKAGRDARAARRSARAQAGERGSRSDDR